MTTTPISTKWIMAVSVSDAGFNKKYRSALNKAGLKQVGSKGDVFASHYNAGNETSLIRVRAEVAKFISKHKSYKHKQAHLTFTITDKQFGMIGSSKVSSLKMRKIPTSMGLLPVTTEQFLYSGNWGNTYTDKHIY